jgi:hypothetical protein
MRKMWKPLVTGILEIIAGGLAIIIGCGLYLSYTVANLLVTVPPLIITLLTYPVIPFILLGALALIAGIFAVQRKHWRLALAGAIAALLVSPLLGIFAVIFTALSRKEYA